MHPAAAADRDESLAKLASKDLPDYYKSAKIAEINSWAEIQSLQLEAMQALNAGQQSKASLLQDQLTTARADYDRNAGPALVAAQQQYKTTTAQQTAAESSRVQAPSKTVQPDPPIAAGSDYTQETETPPSRITTDQGVKVASAETVNAQYSAAASTEGYGYSGTDVSELPDSTAAFKSKGLLSSDVERGVASFKGGASGSVTDLFGAANAETGANLGGLTPGSGFGSSGIGDLANLGGGSVDIGGFTSGLTKGLGGIGMPDLGDPLKGISAFGSGIVDKAKGLIGGLGSVVDPSKLRLAASNLLGGASTARIPQNPVTWLNSSGKFQCAGANGADWRLRVSIAPGAHILYNDPENKLLKPLVTTNGVIFPITPSLNISNTAAYASGSLVHSNYNTFFYERSEVGEIAINGEFPIQHTIEGQYLLAVIYFFRAATKMFWGKERNAGAPPPMLYLDGYGSHYFPHVPCVLKGFTHSLPADVDYIEIQAAGGNEVTRLPTQSQVQIQLQPIYSRTKVKDFTSSQFARGEFIGKGFM